MLPMAQHPQWRSGTRKSWMTQTLISVLLCNLRKDNSILCPFSPTGVNNTTQGALVSNRELHCTWSTEQLLELNGRLWVCLGEGPCDWHIWQSSFRYGSLFFSPTFLWAEAFWRLVNKIYCCLEQQPLPPCTGVHPIHFYGVHPKDKWTNLPR